MQAVHGWLSTYERLVNSQNFFSPYLTQEDLTRWGRDYLQVGNAMELFRRNNVRFIAVNNGIDSENSDTLEFAPLYQYHVGVVCKGHQQESENGH